MEGDAPRTVVITGASAGIRRLAARALAERCNRVGLLTRAEAGLDGCVRTHLSRHLQRVPSINQPSEAGRAIGFASEHAEARELWVGATTVSRIVADRVLPAALARNLMRTGDDSEQTRQPISVRRQGGLYSPLDELPEADTGATGEFEEQAEGRVVQLCAAQHARRSVAALMGRRKARG